MEMKLYTFETIVYIYSMLWHPVIISEIFLIKKVKKKIFLNIAIDILFCIVVLVQLQHLFISS